MWLEEILIFDFVEFFRVLNFVFCKEFFRIEAGPACLYRLEIVFNPVLRACRVFGGTLTNFMH